MTGEERYAVVSCHVERPLDDRVWSAFARLQERRPGGFAIAALLRPPDERAGEDAERWLVRAREAAGRGPLGHHTHWEAPDHARPLSGDPGARVLHEGAWLGEQGLRPTLFCGGGWYFDAASPPPWLPSAIPTARRPAFARRISRRGRHAPRWTPPPGSS